MKAFYLILFFILSYPVVSYGQKGESYEDSVMTRTLQRALEFPDYPIDSVGIIVIQIEKNNGTFVLQPLYTSLKQYKLPADRAIQSLGKWGNIKSIPDGYKRIVHVDFYFGPYDGGEPALPSEEVKAMANEKMAAYRGKIKELKPITIIGYQPIRCGMSPRGW